MKNVNIILKIVTLTIILQTNILPGGFGGRTAEQQAGATTAARNVGLTATYASGDTGGTPGGCCENGKTCLPIPAGTSYIPSFNVYILDKNQNILNATGKNILPINANNTSFTETNTIFTINIFAPSNIAGSPNPTFIDQQFIVFYTLKNPDGSEIYADFETFPSTKIPHYIAISPTGTPTGTNPAPATFVQTSTGTSYYFLKQFLPIKNFPTGQAAWQILNGISPISQSFLFSMNNSTTPAQITIAPISGMYDASLGGTTSPVSGFTPSTGVNALSTLGISLTSGTPSGGVSPNISFSGSFGSTKQAFTATDLQNGLILNVIITASQTSNSYNAVAILRTSDGTKMRKETCLSAENPAPDNPISGLPTSITFTQGPSDSATILLTTDFLNSNITSNNPNLSNSVLPLNLRFSISQPSGSKTIQILML